MAISQVLLLGLSAFVFHRNSYIGKLLTLFSICMACYLAFPLLDLSDSKTASFLVGRLAFATPAVLWLIAYAFFIDVPKIPTPVWVVIAAYMLLRATGSIFFYITPEYPRLSYEFIIFYLVPSILGLGMCGHMIFLALSGYDNDLIEVRRKVRVPVVLALGGLFAMFTLNSGLSLAQQMSEGYIISRRTLQWTIAICIFPVTLAVNALLFRINIDNFRFTMPLSKRESTKAPAHEELDDKDLALKAKILSTMEQEKLYTKNGLTIGEFAKHLKIQEYKLRNIINRHLNHNNFSHFLNGYRIREAEHKLISTNDSIFNIGLDVGYTSLSSFHKGFKEAHGMTPKEFRVLHRHSAKKITDTSSE